MRTGFTQMTLHSLCILRLVFRNELQRDITMQPGVLCLPDDPHASFADLFDQAVMEDLLSRRDAQIRTPR